MRISIRSLYETQSIPYETTWEQLLTWFGACAQSTEPERTALPLFCLGDLGGGTEDTDMGEIWGICLDYDGITEIEWGIIAANAREFRGCVYTSHSNGVKADKQGNACRVRVVLPFAEPLSLPAIGLGVYYQIYSAARYKIGAFRDTAPDTKCKNPSRFWFVPGSNPAGPPCWFQSWDGPSITVAELLANPLVDQQYEIAEDDIDQSELVDVQSLRRLAQKLERKDADEYKQIGRAMGRALSGQAFANAGYRNDVAYRLAGEVAKEYPRGDAARIADYFAAALEAQGEPTYEQFTAQIKRQQRAKQTVARQKAALRTFSGPGAPQVEIPQAEGAQWHQDLPLLVQHEGHYYSRLGPSRDYDERFAKVDARIGIWKRYGIDLEIVDDKHRLETLDRILEKYSVVASAVDGSYMANTSTFDPRTKRLTLAPARRREIAPLFNEQIATWLKLLFGNDYELACQWLAKTTRLEMPAQCLYLFGRSGAGKSLLAYGLARLWKDAAPRFADVTEGFNSSLARNPIVVADEGFGKNVSFKWVRDFITSGERLINEKFKPVYVLNGHIRLLVIANGPAEFSVKHDNLTREAVEAIDERIIQVEAGFHARRYLESLGSVRHWVEDNLIAAHVLAMAEAMKAEPMPAGRWAVQISKYRNTQSGFQTKLAGERYDWFVDFVADYLTDPKQLEIRYTGNSPMSWLVVVKHQKLYISRRAYEYLPRWSAGKETGEFRQALTYFSDGTDCHRLTIRGVKRRYHMIDLDRLWPMLADICDEETVLNTMSGDSEERALGAQKKTA